MITLHAYVRDKVIGLSTCCRHPQKITRSQDIGVLVGGHCCQHVKINYNLHFEALYEGHCVIN